MLILVGIGLVSLQLFFLILCCRESIWERFHVNRTKWLGGYMVGQSVLFLLLLLGGYGEVNWQNVSYLKETIFQKKHANFNEGNLVSDPGLLNLVLNSNIQRPDTSSAQTFLAWQRSFRQKMQEEVFKVRHVAAPSIPKYRIISSEQLDANLSRLFIAFESFDKTEIPGYLFIPGASGQRPAIVVVPGHTKEEESGIAQTAGLQDSYQNSAALQLARAGFITLTFELRGFGYLGLPFNTEHRLVAYNAILSGSFYKAIISQDLQYGVDLLQSLPEVDPLRIGVTGVSFGGEMAVTYAALDPRIQVTVFQGYGGRLGLLHGVTGSREQQPHYCHIIPGYNSFGFQEDLLRLLAPRPVLGIRGSHEAITIDSDFSSTVKESWQLLGVPQAIDVQSLPGGHEYFIDPAIEFFQKHL